jgi:hypothetical protein
MYRGAKMMITVTITFLYGVDHRTIHTIKVDSGSVFSLE